MSPKQALFLGLTLGAVAGACWMKYHLTCPVCKSRWAEFKRQLGLSLIE